MTKSKYGIKTLQPRIPLLKGDPRMKPLGRLTPQRVRGRAGVERRARWLRAHPLCVLCLAETPPRTTAAVEVDHIEPLFMGGADNQSNFQSLCAACHLKKTRNESRY